MKPNNYDWKQKAKKDSTKLLSAAGQGLWVALKEFAPPILIALRSLGMSPSEKEKNHKDIVTGWFLLLFLPALIFFLWLLHSVLTWITG